jgi:hypothetical protein
MGLFDRSQKNPKPTKNAIFTSAFANCFKNIAYVFENPLPSENFTSPQRLESSVEAWKILQEITHKFISDLNYFNMCQDLALSSLNGNYLKMYFERNRLPANYDLPNLEHQEMLPELVLSLNGIQSIALKKSGFSDLQNPLQPFSIDIAHAAWRATLEKSLNWFPCFLNDFSQDWNAQKVCTNEDHEWKNISKNWTCSNATYTFFINAMGLALSDFVFNYLESSSKGNSTSDILSLMEVATSGMEIIGGSLLLFKQKFGSIHF